MKETFKELLFTDTQASAKELLGMELYLEDVRIGRIVETEAYLGAQDSACHSSQGRRTPKNESMYLPAGHWYVYQIHGHYMLNLVTRDQDIPEAVLIRALEIDSDNPQANGPGKLTRLANITKVFDGQNIESSLLQLRRGPKPKDIGSRARIGVTCRDFWRDVPLCFYVLGNRHVSKIRKKGLLPDKETWKNTLGK
ncbi:DNA-3-methyladenine glycosylase [Streptococcus didelphis]|uniref:Putative 3-methyladenine DNA glycosylase n=1 Tax=Streptococcus didelphis TaxID=102886 RepID=A0ABY9LFZ1_9STRE|nr:DNA-3-methyladenine glycosylase [Streptococcus didelphis]WMB27816.1 DNA-3-methyladenine glycosylase [Streptococcus didelphis]WMB29722.1 DNA-3-methyladenine glycosylase [Streptococcus didelphis]